MAQIQIFKIDQLLQALHLGNPVRLDGQDF
jgi:hypothetical protein